MRSKEFAVEDWVNRLAPALRKLGQAQEPSLKRQKTDAYIIKLKRACRWLNIGRGRASAYVGLLEEFGRVREPSEKHVLAYYESYEIVELLNLWEHRVDNFLGLRTKIQAACKKGPTLTDSENISSSSNKPRNDAFAYVMAGRFLAVGISVVGVDGVYLDDDIPKSTADFCFRWNDTEIDVECKRVHSQQQLLKRVKKARTQVTRIGRCGILAIDCSVLMRPTGTMLETRSANEAELKMSQWLENDVQPRIRPVLSPTIIGVILYAKLPAMTATGVVDEKGRFYRRCDCISSILVVGNPTYANQSILRDIAQRLKVYSFNSGKRLGNERHIIL